MKLNLHDRTPAPKMPKWMEMMFIGLFMLSWFPFALGAYALIAHAHAIAMGIAMLLLPWMFGAWFLWDQRNLDRSYLELTGNTITVVEYPFGRKRVTKAAVSQIDHTEQIIPQSMRVRGPRAGGPVSYIVFFDANGKQLFKIFACPETLEFESRIMQMKL